LAKATISLAAITASAILGDYLGDLVNEARTRSKDKRAADQARTEKRKDPNEPQDKNTQKHTGDATEAHKDQKNAGSLELGDKEEGIKSSYPGQPAHKTAINRQQKVQQEAQEELEKMKTEKSTNQDSSTDDKSGGEGDQNTNSETTDEKK
jgi:hypothetical protein